MGETALVVKDFRKSYGDMVAEDGINLEVQRGEIFGLLAFALAIYLFSWDSRNLSRRSHPALAALALAPCLVAMFMV